MRTAPDGDCTADFETIVLVGCAAEILEIFYCWLRSPGRRFQTEKMKDVFFSLTIHRLCKGNEEYDLEKDRSRRLRGRPWKDRCWLRSPGCKKKMKICSFLCDDSQSLPMAEQ